jgi:hypothetical protein
LAFLAETAVRRINEEDLRLVPNRFIFIVEVV